MKHFLLSILILLVFQTTKAQYRGEFDSKNIFISAGGEVGAPSNTPYNVSYGAYAQAEVKVINHIGLTLTGEYMGYNFKSSLLAGPNNQQHPSFIPLKAGIKYYAGPNFFFAGEVGSTVQTNTDIGNMFVYSLGFGFDIPLDKHNDVEVGFSYQNYAQSQYQTTGLKVAYRVGW
jgi:hypothetical protein